MQISLNWLKDFIDLDDLSVDDICGYLTGLGLEVETIEQVCPIEGEIVVGKILDTAPHPEADKLQITTVTTGEESPLTIVCGAPNAHEGLTVAVAKVGSKLPDLKIKSSKIRGVKSSGMLCSGQELQINNDNDGIMELDSSLKLGSSIADLFRLQDTRITIGLTPNRPDCLGIIGIARDLSAKLERPFRYPEIKKGNSQAPDSCEKVDIQVTNEDDCSRFLGLFIDNVKPIASPKWMQRRLETCGMRPINLIVDASNYVMLEYGQPNHAYDHRFIKGSKIIVRRAQTDELIQTLDEQKHKLTEDDLLICDDNGPIGLAGIMGGAESEVKDDTTGIVVEVAQFNPSVIRKTSKKTGLHTEASHRFERGTDVTILEDVAYRIGQVIAEGLKEAGLPTPTISSQPNDIYPTPFRAGRIALRLTRLKRVLGLHGITTDHCEKVLIGLGFKFLDKKEDRMVFEVPSWRRDIEREADLIEEFARVHGYDKLPLTLPMMEIKPLDQDPAIGFVDKIKISMAGTGFDEIISFPFMSEKDLLSMRVPSDHTLNSKVILKNPLNEEQSFLQTTTLINLIKAVSRNKRFGDPGCKLFEVARCFFLKNTQNEKGFYSAFQSQGRHIFGRAREDERPIERTLMGGILDHQHENKNWDSEARTADFFDGKAAILETLSHFGIDGIRFSHDGISQMPWMNARASATIVHGDFVLGYVGELHPETALNFDLDFKAAPVVFELDLDSVFDVATFRREVSTITTQYPSVTRDIAFVVPTEVTYERFKEALDTFKRRNLKETRIFDLYTGEGVEDGKKSMAFSFSFQSVKKTLTDKEVEKEVELLKNWLREKIQAELR